MTDAAHDAAPHACLTGRCLSRYPTIDCDPPASCMARATLRAMVDGGAARVVYPARAGVSGSGDRTIDALSALGLVTWTREADRVTAAVTEAGRAMR